MKAYTVILSPDPEAGGFVAMVPAMRGALAECDTREQALSKISEIMGIWLELAAEDGYEPAKETPELLGQELACVLEDRAEAGWDSAVELVPVVPTVQAAA